MADNVKISEVIVYRRNIIALLGKYVDKLTKREEARLTLNELETV
jgi:hypothetical protein